MACTDRYECCNRYDVYVYEIVIGDDFHVSDNYLRDSHVWPVVCADASHDVCFEPTPAKMVCTWVCYGQYNAANFRVDWHGTPSNTRCHREQQFCTGCRYITVAGWTTFTSCWI